MVTVTDYLYLYAGHGSVFITIEMSVADIYEEFEFFFLAGAYPAVAYEKAPALRIYVEDRITVCFYAYGHLIAAVWDRSVYLKRLCGI